MEVHNYIFSHFYEEFDPKMSIKIGRINDMTCHIEISECQVVSFI